MANTFTFANQTLTDADIFGGINFVHDLNTGDEFSIGNTASASVRFVTDTQLPLYSKDQTNGTFTWTQNNVSRGRFFITEVTKTSGKYEVTAYDAMILLETSITALSLTFPLSVATAAAAIASFINCTTYGTINNSTMEAAAGTIDDTTTCRQLLGWVAEASGCSVKIDGADQIVFMYYPSSGITVSASAYKEFGLDVADYTCAAIDNVTICDMAGMTAATAGAGTNSLFIQGNPFLYEATNTEAAVILGCVDSFVYAPFKCEMFDENGLEVGTIATFGSTATLVMHIESSENGAIASAVGSDTRAEFNKSIDIIVNEALAVANDAQQTAQATNLHFWYTATGDEAGAHIAEVDKPTFDADPQGGNVRIDSNSLDIRDGTNVLATFGVDGAVFKSPEGVIQFSVAPSGNPSSAEFDVFEYRLNEKGIYELPYTPKMGCDIRAEIYISFPSPNPSVSRFVHFTGGTSESKTVTVQNVNYTLTYNATAETIDASNLPSNSFLASVDYIGTDASVDLGELTVGTRTGDNGNGSAVIGRSLTAEYDNQVAIGKFNNNKSANLFEIGNGTNDSARSNAFEVNANGNIAAGGDVKDGSGNVLSKVAYRGYFYVNMVTATTITAINSYKLVPIEGGLDARGYSFMYDDYHTGAIICKKPGTYVISVQLAFDVATSGDLMGLAVYKNGSLVIGPQYTRVGGNYDTAAIAPTILKLAMDDYLQIYIRNNTGARGKTSDGIRVMCWEI